MNRYQTGTEGEYQPGSGGKVLANKLGITSAAEMDSVELQMLEQIYEPMVRLVANALKG